MEIIWIIFLLCTFVALLPAAGFIIGILIIGKIFEWLFGGGSK